MCFPVSFPRWLIAAGLLLLAAAAHPCPADRTLEVVVPYAAGGSTDAVNRLLAQAVSARLKRPVVVRNIPGASGALGVKEVLSAEPAGCTVLAGSINTVILVPLLNRRAGFATQDLRPLAKVGSSDLVLIAAPSFVPGNLQELQEHVRASGKQVVAGHPGRESTQALALDLLEERLGTRFLQVPYNGSARLVVDLMGGTIEVAVVAAPAATPLVRDGRVKALATLNARNGFVLDSWSGWFAPRRATSASTAAVQHALMSALADPAVRRSLQQLGVPAAQPEEQEQFDSDVQRTRRAYADIVNRPQRRPN